MLTVLQALAAIGVAVGASSPMSGAENLDLEPIRGLVVQHDGRWPPLDTVARDLVESVTGREAFRDGDSLGWLLAWTFDPKSAMGEPLIAIRNAELRAELQLPASQTVFSYAELVNHPRLRLLIQDLSKIEKGRKPNPLEKKVSAINEKLVLLVSTGF